MISCSTAAHDAASASSAASAPAAHVTLFLGDLVIWIEIVMEVSRAKVKICQCSFHF